MRERELFLAALEFEDAAARQAHLESACGEDAELLSRVKALLASHESRSQFLNTPVVKQITDDATEGTGATLHGADGSPREDDKANSTGAEDNMATIPPTDPTVANGRGNEMNEEIPLGYLQPATKSGSLGRLGHYEILELIGRGACGTVLKAFDDRLHRVVAIKVLSPELAATSPARKRFLREARSSAQVRHENVVSIYDVEDQPIPYLVMEYIPGQTLQQRLDEYGPLDVPDVLRLGKQIADGLAAAHDQQLIHRDVKPGNILLDTSVNDHVKITDFGLARTADDASMTQSGMIAGTPLYMAPEQTLGHKLDHRADLFSFGSVLYQMISGRPPFRAPTTIAVLKRVAEDTPRPITEIIPEVPGWMCRLIGHLHAKNPAERYGSAKEVSDLLAQCLAEVEEGRKPKIAPPSRTMDESDKRVRRRGGKRVSNRPLLRIAALVLLFLVAGFGITEATGVSTLTDNVIRLTTGSGTLVIETDDENVKVVIDGAGNEVTLRGGGVEELTLRPGDYKIAALKDGKPVKQQLVSITRNGRTVVRISLEPATAAASSNSAKPPDRATDPWPKDAPPPAIAPFDAVQAKQYQQAWAKYLGVPVDNSNSLGMKLRLIPPGRFRMRPDYEVTITKPFRLGTYEVTIAQFREFVEETEYKTSAEVTGNGKHVYRVGGALENRADYTWNHTDVNRGDNYPVAQISWDDAAMFCEWLTGKTGDRYRLPTEGEWEWACRAGSLNDYHFGHEKDKLGDHVWYLKNSQEQAHPVGLKKPNSWGLFDMHGNVCEYCLDWHVRDLPSGQANDPRGPTAGQFRVTRGGGYIGTPKSLTLNSRGAFAPSGSLNHFGMRVVCEVDPDSSVADKAGPGDRTSSAPPESR